VDEMRRCCVKKVWRRTRVYVEELFSHKTEQVATIWLGVSYLLSSRNLRTFSLVSA
jgi:hypothetical protein